MIQPEFIAQLRNRYRAELVLVLIQLEQLCPGFWPDLNDLAAQLGTDRATLNRSMRKLEDLQLLRRASISNGGGTFVWWVARQPGDQPQDKAEPAWVVRDIRRRMTHRVPLTQRWTWAAQHGIPKKTVRGFLMGDQLIMRDRWQLISTPYDQAAA